MDWEDGDPNYSIVRDAKFWKTLLGEIDRDSADFHETIAGAPFMMMLGRIVLDFNYLENQVKSILWSYIGDSFEAGHALTAALGTGTIIEIISNSAKRHGETKEVLDLLKFGAKAFDVCRNNRNALAHSMTVGQISEDATVWVRASRKFDMQQTQMKISLTDLLIVSKDIAQTATFMMTLSMWRHMQIRSSSVLPELPKKFAMPTMLKSRDVNLKDEAKKLGLSE